MMGLLEEEKKLIGLVNGQICHFMKLIMTS